MTSESEKMAIVTRLVDESIYWEIDSEKFLWLTALSSHGSLRIKINPSFPDGGGAYCLMRENEFLTEFDDFPENWTRAPLKWPDSAKK